jgi:hypothetical protein
MINLRDHIVGSFDELAEVRFALLQFCQTFTEVLVLVSECVDSRLIGHDAVPPVCLVSTKTCMPGHADACHIAGLYPILYDDWWKKTQAIARERDALLEGSHHKPGARPS